MQEIAHAVCLPPFSIMLRAWNILHSFHALLESHPTAGSSARHDRLIDLTITTAIFVSEKLLPTPSVLSPSSSIDIGDNLLRTVVFIQMI
jgi:hypothetical protein